MMDDVERWIYLGGPEPVSLKRLLDAMRELPPLSSADTERLGQGVMKRIDEALSRKATLASMKKRSLRLSLRPIVDKLLSEREAKSARRRARGSRRRARHT